MAQELPPLNYFNYFTEVEEHFQRARGTGLFLLSPLDWALIDTWKQSGVPLEAVLRGIDAAFEKWRGKKNRVEKVNGLAWASQAVLDEAARMQDGAAPDSPTRPAAEAPFSLEDLQRHLAEAAARIVPPELAEVRRGVEDILAHAETHYAQLEALEQRLSALEDKMIATARSRQSEADLTLARRELDAQLRPYRGKMSAPQLVMLEKQYLDRWLFEHCQLPRLSLFYVR